MPNRRRSKASTAMSAFAALAVASPVAAVAVTQLSGSTDAPQHREFVQAAMVTDLPSELMSALSQGLSSFGINLPPMLNGAPAAPTTLTTPGLATPGLTSPGLTAPSLASPGLTAPGLTTPGAEVPPLTATTPGLDAGLANPALTSPALTSPAGDLSGLTAPGLSTPGLTTPAAGLDPALTPISTGALTMPGEVAKSAEVMQFIAKELSPDTYVNVMNQYRPVGDAHRITPIDRSTTRDEYRQALENTKKAGLERLD